MENDAENSRRRNHFRLWIKIKYKFYHAHPTARLNLLAIPIGICTGLGAWIFYSLIHFIFDYTIIIPNEWLIIHGYSIWAWIPFLIVPGVGGLFVGLLNLKIPPESKGHGIPNIIETINLRGGIMDPWTPFTKMVTASLTIGTGGSAGYEGPIAQIGAGIGSIFGQKLKLSSNELRDLVVAGVSGAIGGIFNAPIGGVLFAIEIVRRRASINSFLPLIISSTTSVVMTHWLVGSDPAFSGYPAIIFSGLIEIPFYIILGVITGLTTVIWIRGFFTIERILEKIYSQIHIPSWAKPAIGGLLTGLISVLIYCLFGNQWTHFTIMGATHDPMTYLFRKELPNYPPEQIIAILLLIMILKIIATSFTIGSGGSGGLFTPTLFMGVFFGVAFGLFTNILFNTNFDLSLFALIGMAAFFAGSIRAPFTAVIMASEITGDYFLTIPLLITVAFSMIASSLVEHDDLYIKRIHDHGLILTEEIG